MGETVDEILKRLNEIKAEAKAIAADDPERTQKLQALAQESKDLRAEYAKAEVEAEALAAIDEEVPAEAPAKEDGGDDADDAPDEGGKGGGAGDTRPEPVVPNEMPQEGDEQNPGGDLRPEPAAPRPDAEKVPLAAAAASANPVDTDLGGSSEEASPMALIASGNVGGTNPGDKLDLRAIDRIHRHASRSGAGTRAIFASMATAEGEVLSERNTAEQNAAIMASASKDAVKPITAAAAFCGPNDVILDINTAGTAARPVAALFDSVPVRGPFTYMKTAGLADVSPGINIWTEAQQTALDPDDLDGSTWKQCVDLSCRAETEVTPYAIVACTTMGVWQQLSAPEQVANWLTQMEKQYSRVAEAKLLDQVRAQSYVYSHNNGLGLWSAIQPLLANTAQLVAQVNRGTTEGYVLVVPYGTLDVMAADEVMRGFSNNLAKQRIQALLRENYGISIVEAMETDTTVQADFRTGATDLGTKTLGVSTAFTPGDATALTTPMYLVRPDAFVHGQTDVVDAGYNRDVNHIRQNLVNYFWEGMEFLEKTGDHLSFVYDVTACPSGMASALVDGPDCTPA